MKRWRSALSLGLRLSKWLALAAPVLLLALLLARYLVVPVLLFFRPALDSAVYDWGFYGVFPQRQYHSFHLPSPDARPVVWRSPVCDVENDRGGLVTLDVHGPWVGTQGPMLLDLQGNLVWRDTSYGAAAMNVKVQTWRGDPYLTFWAGQKERGNFYMLDSGFNLVRNISVVGEGLAGDPHEFRITPDGTALVIVYNLTRFDVHGASLPGSAAGAIDGIVQELDIETGELLFEWRASDHLRPQDGEYLRSTFEAAPYATTNGWFRNWGAPRDYYHFNSVDKDSEGNYLLSVRFTQQVICISGLTGEILGGFGGRVSDFVDLSDGLATSFHWQHDARWIDEGNGIFGLFDNGVMYRHMFTAWHSQGLLLHLDLNNQSVRHLHSYPSSGHIRSLSQGSFQYLPATNASEQKTGRSADRVFIGWGAAAAFSLHDVESEEVLCETHFAPSMFFSHGPATSYRVYRTPPSWTARPTAWDPHAAFHQDAVYVSWNGGMEVRRWVLQKNLVSDSPEQDELWLHVATMERSGFETRIDVPRVSGGAASPHARYRVAALDANGDILRYSNTVPYQPPPSSGGRWFFIGAGIPLLLFAVFRLAQRRERLSRLRAFVLPTKATSYTRAEDVALLRNS